MMKKRIGIVVFVKKRSLIKKVVNMKCKKCGSEQIMREDDGCQYCFDCGTLYGEK